MVMLDANMILRYLLNDNQEMADGLTRSVHLIQFALLQIALLIIFMRVEVSHLNLHKSGIEIIQLKM